MKRRKITEKPEEIPRVVNACQLICNNIEIRNNEKSPEPCGSRDFPGIPGGGERLSKSEFLISESLIVFVLFL